MKKAFSLFLAIILVCMLVACDNKVAEVNCPHCDKEIVSDAIFCSYCGTALNGEKPKEDDTNIVTSTPTENTAPTEPDPSKTETDAPIAPNPEASTPTESTEPTETDYPDKESDTPTDSDSNANTPDESAAPAEPDPDVNASAENTEPIEPDPIPETSNPAESSSPSADPHEGYERCSICSIWFKGDSTYCSSCTCRIDHCDNPIYSSSTIFCSEHKCANSTCMGGRDSYCGSIYCSHHRCDSGRCPEGNAYGANYCTYHKCGKCANGKEDGSNYCNSHNCNAGNCKADRFNNSSYCSVHKCNNPSCTNAKESFSSNDVNYCSSHNCRNCQKDPVDGSQYCSEHKCSVSGCKNGRNTTVGGISYCNTHKPK